MWLVSLVPALVIVGLCELGGPRLTGVRSVLAVAAFGLPWVVTVLALVLTLVKAAT